MRKISKRDKMFLDDFEKNPLETINFFKKQCEFHLKCLERDIGMIDKFERILVRKVTDYMPYFSKD